MKSRIAKIRILGSTTDVYLKMDPLIYRLGCIGTISLIIGRLKQHLTFYKGTWKRSFMARSYSH